MDKIIVAELDGKKPKEKQIGLIDKINREYPEIVEQRKEKRTATIEKLQKELGELPQPGSGKDEKENEKIERRRERLSQLIQEKLTALETYLNEMEQIKTRITGAINLKTIGDVVKVPIPGSIFSSWGIYLGTATGKAKNPYTLGNISLRFAVTDGRKMVQYNLTPDQRDQISGIVTESQDISEADIAKVNAEWNEMVKKASAKREKRHILTENIVAASGDIGALNKLIKYNTKDGIIKNGIFLNRDYGNEGEDKRALLPITEAHSRISTLDTDRTFADHQVRVRFKRISDTVFDILITKKGNFALHTDQGLRSLTMKREGQSQDELPEFVQNGGDMTGALHISKLQSFLERLSSFGLRYYGPATALEDWEKENQADWKEKTRGKGQVFRYKLGRPYGQGSNPTAGFTAYKEPSADYPFGVVQYSRELSDKEKYNYSLVPIFKNVEQPYKAWKAYMEKTALKKDFKAMIKSLNGSPVYKSVQTLGYFITNNPHQDGNIEFVFGDYDQRALGQTAYEDIFGPITPIDILIEQLTIELEPSMTADYE